MTRSAGSSARSCPSRVVSRSPGRGPPHDDRALQPGAVVGVQRLAELEHDVVGDVDGQADRAHARPARAGAAARRARARSASRPVTVRATKRSQPAGSSTRTGWPSGDGRHVEQARVGQRQPEGRRGLAGDARAPTAGSRGRASRRGRAPRRAARAARPRRRPAGWPGRARGSRRTRRTARARRRSRSSRRRCGRTSAGWRSGSRRAARRRGCAKATTSPATKLVAPHTTSWARAADVDVAEADRLLEAGQLLDVEDAADHDARDVVADAVDLLDLEAGADERGGDLVGGGGQAGHEGAQPGHGDAHVRPPGRRGG